MQCQIWMVLLMPSYLHAVILSLILWHYFFKEEIVLGGDAMEFWVKHKSDIFCVCCLLKKHVRSQVTFSAYAMCSPPSPLKVFFFLCAIFNNSGCDYIFKFSLIVTHNHTSILALTNRTNRTKRNPPNKVQIWGSFGSRHILDSVSGYICIRFALLVM